MAAFFAGKEGGAINILKLIKLLYLSDRLSFERYDAPISWDHFVSMDHGPVLTVTLNLINGSVSRVASEIWEQWIRDRENYNVSLAIAGCSRDNLNQLSNAEIEVLEEIWQRFGSFDQWQLVEYTHQNCPEWQDPDGSSIPIRYEDIFKALGRSAVDASSDSNRLNELHDIDKAFANL